MHKVHTAATIEVPASVIIEVFETYATVSVAYELAGTSYSRTIFSGSEGTEMFYAIYGISERKFDSLDDVVNALTAYGVVDIPE